MKFDFPSRLGLLALLGGENKSLKCLLESMGLRFSTLSVTSLPTDLLAGSEKASGVAGQRVWCWSRGWPPWEHLWLCDPTSGPRSSFCSQGGLRRVCNPELFGAPWTVSQTFQSLGESRGCSSLVTRASARLRHKRPSHMADRHGFLKTLNVSRPGSWKHKWSLV